MADVIEKPFFNREIHALEKQTLCGLLLFVVPGRAGVNARLERNRHLVANTARQKCIFCDDGNECSDCTDSSMLNVIHYIT
ncbi:MAG TPA: hypothetical protein VIK18_10995 [Pirellulales bacterium]